MSGVFVYQSGNYPVAHLTPILLVHLNPPARLAHLAATAIALIPCRVKSELHRGKVVTKVSRTNSIHLFALRLSKTLSVIIQL